MTIIPAIWTITGLPAHPLLVHGTTVLAVLLGVLAIVLVLQNAQRRRAFAGPLAVISLGLLILAQLTVMSGEQLAEATDAENEPEIHEHAEAGELTRNLMVLLTVALAGLAVIERREGAEAVRVAASGGSTSDRRSLLSGAFRLGTGVAAIATIGMDIKAGHTGAWAVWHEELSGVSDSESGETPKSSEPGESDESSESSEGAEPTKEGGA